MTTDELVDEIFGRCRERIERGEEVDFDDVLRAHPDLADPLRKRFAAVRLVDRAGARGRRGDAGTATRVGAQLGPYRIESVLGAGGMGTVYLARVEAATASLAAGDRVAVKVFHAHLATRERFGARFRREAELGQRVRHANVVRTLDAGDAMESDRPVRFLVMEHVEGRTLRELLGELTRLPEELVRHVGREVAKGLAAIHAAGAVHRDLKPENVIVTDDHVVKVMDLGVAHVEAAASLSETGAFVGSLRYAAPEQFGKGAEVDARADLHALGLLLFELACGVHPFAGEELGEVVRQVLGVRPRRLGELSPQTSPFLEELVAQLLEKDRERRPASAEGVAAILVEGEASSWWKERAIVLRRETRRPLRRIRVPRETALYGRDTEIARLRALFEKAKSGDGQVVLVEGEAGIGKSRLVDEFALSLWRDGEDIDFLFGSYPPGGAASAASAFSTAYREHLGDDEAAVGDALPQTPLLVPAFAALLRGDAPPEGAEKLTKDSIQTLFVHATRSIAAQRTTIVLIDDLHFAPEEGRALFTSLALAVPGHRILLIGGARPSLDEKWAAGYARIRNAMRLPLERLSPKELVELLQDALSSEHLAEELSGKIAAKSDGNPFFVFEILRGLREGNFLTRRPDGTWITTRAIQDIEVPPSIVEVIQARVLDLDKDERDALEVAACVGFEFDAALVGAVLRVEPIPLLQRLGRIEKAHRLVRSVGHRFAFDHHQVQEVLYAGLSPPLREAYHAAIADALEARSAAAAREPKDLDGALCVELAEHFLRGAKGGRGLRYLDAALDHLEARWLNDAAVRLCDLALATPELVQDGARSDLLLRKADRLDYLGRRDAERMALDEAVALADAGADRGRRAKSRRALSALLWTLGRFVESRVLAEETLTFARAAGDRVIESATEVNLALISIFVEGHVDEARVRAERGVALAQAVGDRVLESSALANLGHICNYAGLSVEAQTYCERAVVVARESGSRKWEMSASANLGSVYYSRGRYSESRAAFGRKLALALETASRGDEAVAKHASAAVAVQLGELARARDLSEGSLVLCREIGARGSEVESIQILGTLSRRLGRFDEASELLSRALELSRELGYLFGEGAALEALGLLALERGDLSGAEECFAAGITALQATPHVASSVHLALGSLRAARGLVQSARAELETARDFAGQVDTPGVVALSRCELALLPGGDAHDALAAWAERRDRVDTETMGEILLRLWRLTHDRTHVAEAKRLLDFVVEHAPPEDRETMLTNVRLHREIVAAWNALPADESGPAAGRPARE